MKVIDKITGNTLESDIEIVVKSWRDNPERFRPVDWEKPVRRAKKTVETE